MINSISPVLGQRPQVYQAASTLLRITQLKDALPKGKTQECLKALEALWQKNLELISRQSSENGTGTLKLIKQEIIQDLEQLDKNFTHRLLKHIKCNVSPIYSHEISAAQTAAELDQCAYRFFKDIKSVAQSFDAPPLIKSFRGVNGPTFIVGYPRPDNQSSTMNFHNYVIKWSSLAEPCSARLYEGFARNFDAEGRFYTYIVPETARIDLEKGTHEMPNCSTTTMNAFELSQLRNKFFSILIQTIKTELENNSNLQLHPERIKKSLQLLATDEFQQLLALLSNEHKNKLLSLLAAEKMYDQLAMLPSSEEQDLLALFPTTERRKIENLVNCPLPNSTPKPVDNQILLMEKISGSNLFDFAREKHENLSIAQKEKLFERLSRLAFLDVIMGNFDRLIQVNYDKQADSFKLTDLESNLGNVMIIWSGEESEQPELYAIDNGVDPLLVEDPKYKEKYLQFLEKLLSSSKMAENLADFMAQSMLNCLETNAKEEEEKIDIEKFTSFREDLSIEGIARPAFARGITRMMDHLRTTLLPSWESEKSEPLKNYLLTIYPELLQAVSERLTIIK